MALVTLIIGIIVGYCLSLWLCKRNGMLDVVGTLNLDQSDPTEPPYIFLEVNRSPGEIFSHKYVLLTTSKRNYVSQK